MKVVYNDWIPFRGYKCINLFGILFVRRGCYMSERDFNHEAIHTAQMKEMLYVGFYLWYLVEWLIRLFGKGDAYRNLSFEKESYDNEGDLTYLENRPMFAWWWYL